MSKVSSKGKVAAGIAIAACVVIAVIAVIAVLVTVVVPRSSTSSEGSEETVVRTPLEPGKTVADFFPDPVFASCIAHVLGVSVSDEMAVEDCAAITDLTFPALVDEDGQPYDFSQVQSIEGIQLFTDLNNLDLGGFSSLVSADQLGDLVNVQHLNLEGTSIENAGFIASMTKLSQVALPATVSDVSVLASCPALQSVSVGSASADISALNGKNVQIVVPADFNRDAAYASAQSGNTVTVQNADGSLDIYQPADGQVTVMHM